jgi:hypothetical protein
MSLLSQASLVMTANAIKQSKIYSIIPTNGNGDASFARGTLASSTLTSASGLIESVPYNLITFSQLFSNSNWLKNTTVILSENNTAPNRTLTATRLTADGANPTLQQTITGTIGLQYTTSFWVRRVSGTAQVYLRCGDVSPVSNISVTSTWQLFSFTSTSATTIIRCGIGITSGILNTDIIEIWGAQLVQGSVPKDYFFTTDRLNVPRLNYESYGGCPSLLLEPQRTNVLVNSVWAGGGTIPTSWTANFATGTSTPTASIKNPNVTAYRFVTTSAQRQEFYQQFTYNLVPTSPIVCLSVYVESVTTTITVFQLLRVNPTTVGNGNTVFLKNNVVIASGTNIEAGNTYSIQYEVTVSGTFQFRVGCGVNNAVAGNFVLSMPQLEQGASSQFKAPYATSFIPTTTTFVTRNSDVFEINDLYSNGIITDIGGTWFLEINNNLSLIRDGISSGISLDANPAFFDDGFVIRNNFNGTSVRLGIEIRQGGSIIGTYSTLVNTVKIAIMWNGIITNIYVNGVAVIQFNSFTTKIMNYLSAKADDVPKYIKSMLFFPLPLSNSEMVALTSSTNYISYENMAINLNYVIQ